jgi:nucleoside-diphosphate-sugar epimerase
MTSGRVRRGEKYLVTGGAGFIGSNLVHSLVQGGATVRVLDNFSTGRRENLRGLEDHIELIEGSVTDPDVCRDAVRGIDYVLHQAALPSVPRSVRDPFSTHEACATGTLRLLAASHEAGIRRFVYASSSSAYGVTPQECKSEDLPTVPLSPYAVSKLAGEFYTRLFFHVYGLETVALRYFNIFGPRQDPASPYSAVIPLFIGHALAGTAPTINGDGDQTRDFTFVGNAVSANLLACVAEKDDVGGQVFNVGCGERISVNQLWRKIRDVIGSGADASYGPASPGDVRHSLASLDRSRNLLGYAPRVRLEEGLETTIDWYRTEVPRPQAAQSARSEARR